MTKRLLILFYAVALCGQLVWSQETINDSNLRRLVMEFGQAEVSIPFPGISAMEPLTRNVSVSSVKEKEVFVVISPRTIEWFISAGYNYTIIKRTDNKGVTSAGSVTQAMDWQSYPTYTQYDSIMHRFTTLYPTLCRLDTIGRTTNGRYVLALKISDNVALNEDEPKVFYSSSIHGDEIGGYVLMLRLADYLLKNYNLITRVKNMVDNLEIWINPLANPDGTYTTGNTITYPTRYNAAGMDLNRNFPDPLDPSIVVPKEDSSMMKFLKKHRFTISANFHAGAEVVNWPWDRWLSKIHADNSWFNTISRAYVDTVHKYSGPAYLSELDNGVTRGSVWYVIYGGRQDYVTWELQGREVTIELDDTKETPAAQLELLWQYNWRSLLGYFENALYGIHGLVKDYNSSAPIPAKVFITGHDVDRSEVYTDTISGRFIRMLSPGNWNLTFTANGYKDTTVNNITVVAGQRTDITVQMKSIISNIDSTIPEVPLLYPNPAEYSINARLPEKLNGKINIKIITSTGQKAADFNRVYTSGTFLQIDISGLPGGSYAIVFSNMLTGATYRSRIIVLGRNH
jgi:hypothetical protein